MTVLTIFTDRSQDVTDAPAGEGTENGTLLLDEVCDTLRAYVVFPSGAAADATTLWIACTHGQPAWQHATRLIIKSPLKQCGKSRLLDLVDALAYSALTTINISPAALVRSIGDDPPTLCVDECDAIFRRRRGEVSESAETIRGILNGGHQRGRPYIRWDYTNKERELCPSFAMAALAGIGDWAPDTLEDRAIVVSMRRRGPDETVRPLRRHDYPGLHELRERLHAWVRAHLADLEQAVPELPVEDRAADCWEPLVALADAAGGHWPKLARNACLELTGGAPTDSETAAKERILEDIREVFGTEEQLYTRTLLDRLHGLEEAPWSDWFGHLLRPRDLAGLLRPYGIRSKKLKESGRTESLWGYTRASFTDAWTRYLPPVSSSPELAEPPEPDGWE